MGSQRSVNSVVACAMPAMYMWRLLGYVSNDANHIRILSKMKRHEKYEYNDSEFNSAVFCADINDARERTTEFVEKKKKEEENENEIDALDGMCVSAFAQTTFDMNFFV